MSLISSQLGRALSNASNVNIGSKASAAAMRNAADTAMGSRRLGPVSGMRSVVQGSKRRLVQGSSAGYVGGRRTDLQLIGTGYNNPVHQTARGNIKKLMKTESAPITYNTMRYNRYTDYHMGTDKTLSSYKLRRNMR